MTESHLRLGATTGLRLRCAALRGALCALLLASAGCLNTRYTTNTARSATEQLLVSTSIRKALGQLVLPDLEGRTVTVQTSAVPEKDVAYLKSVLEARLGQRGARVVSADQAELTLVVMVGAVGSVARSASFGVPSLPVPSLGATPEIPFLGSTRQRGWTQAQLATWDRSGTLVQLSEPVMHQSRFDIISVLFFEFRSNDIYPDEDGSIAID